MICKWSKYMYWTYNICKCAWIFVADNCKFACENWGAVVLSPVNSMFSIELQRSHWGSPSYPYFPLYIGPYNMSHRVSQDISISRTYIGPYNMSLWGSNSYFTLFRIMRYLFKKKMNKKTNGNENLQLIYNLTNILGNFEFKPSAE